MRVSSPNITELKENEVFVFGSNEAGIHGAGAARLAYNKFGATLGQGYGLQGRSYAIPSKDHMIQTLNIRIIKVYVDDFIEYAKGHPQLNFLVTEIGCGLAGLTVGEVAPLFKAALEVPNIYLPQTFLDTYGS